MYNESTDIPTTLTLALLYICRLSLTPHNSAVQTLENENGKKSIKTGWPAKLAEFIFFLSLSKRLKVGAYCPIEMDMSIN